MIASVAALLLAAAPVTFGLADLDCVLGAMTPAGTAQVARNVEATGGNPTNEALEPLTTAVATCRRTRGFSETAAGELSFMLLVKVVTEDRLERKGVPVARLREVFEQQSEANRTAVSQPNTDYFARALEAAGVPSGAVARGREEIDFYVGYLVLRERLRRGLSV